MKSPRFCPVITWTLSMVLLLLAAGPASATPAWSWNLSRDRMTGANQNPNGPWSFVASTVSTLPFVGQNLANHATSCFGNSQLDCWFDSDNALVGHATSTGLVNGLFYVQGVPILHPGANRYVAVRWVNPTGESLDIQILGRVTDLDYFWGNGVGYSVVRGTITLASGGVKSVTSSLDSRTFYATTTVAAGQDVYFIIDRIGDYTSDSTELDVLITGTKTCTIPACSPL
jgi:hypothetical protein